MSEVPITRAEFEELRSEVAHLKTLLTGLRNAAPLVAEEVDESTIHLIAAAVAAYLGKRATVKFVRRAREDTGAWRSNGRAQINGSHELPRVKGW